jgi:hypothetical protein
MIEDISTFDLIQYKINAKINWKAIAPLYHKNSASTEIGSNKTILELIKFADINLNDTVLDLAGDTGSVLNKAARHMIINWMVIEVIEVFWLEWIFRSTFAQAKLSTFSYLVRYLFVEIDIAKL